MDTEEVVVPFLYYIQVKIDQTVFMDTIATRQCQVVNGCKVFRINIGETLFNCTPIASQALHTLKLLAPCLINVSHGTITKITVYGMTSRRLIFTTIYVNHGPFVQIV
jgi:hypothetical protein